MAQDARGPWSRESRLLLLTVALCAAVLLILARLRFPAAQRVEVTTPPLERLAARASYDALAADIERAAPAITANLIVLRVVPRASTEPRRIQDELSGTPGARRVRHVVAVRTSTDTAVAALDAQTRIDGIVGQPGPGGASVVNLDPIRGWARIRVPPASTPPVQHRQVPAIPGPLYVVVAEGTQAGATLRPVFLGQSASFTSREWSRPLLPLGGISVAPGALLFTLGGEWLGAAVMDGGGLALVEAGELLDVGARLSARQPGAVGDLGVSVQRLTHELGRATGVDRGVVISEVEPDGPATGTLDAGDVVTRLGDREVATPEDFLLEVAQHPVEEPLDVSFVRSGELHVAAVTPRPVAFGTRAEAVSLVHQPGIGTRVAAGGTDFFTGLEPGDVVVGSSETRAPTPAQLRAALAGPPAREFLALVVRRNGRQQVVAVPTTGGGNASSR